MAKRNEIEELDFDNVRLEPDEERYDPTDHSNFGDRSYRWQDDARRYEIDKPTRSPPSRKKRLKL